MQDQLPIFTLDPSWLWCETWCSQESLKRAKTSESGKSGIGLERLNTRMLTTQICVITSFS